MTAMLRLSFLLAAASLQFASSQTTGGDNPFSGYMPELGYEEPDWKYLDQGNHMDRTIVQTEDFFWGTVRPQDTDASLCQWEAVGERCRTDLSWIAASVGINSALFENPVVNYMMRFYIWGACFRSNQHATSQNSVAQFCAQWWKDPVTDEKIDVSQICYNMEWTENANTNQVKMYKTGCAHRVPYPLNATDAGKVAPANATWSHIDTVSDFIPGTMFNGKMEKWENRDPWRACERLTLANDWGFSPERDRCQQEAMGTVLGMDVPTLRALAMVHKAESAKCSTAFSTSTASTAAQEATGGTLARDLCEIDSSAIVENNLQTQLGFVGNPEEPADLDPVITPPPPPHPSPPPAPPSPPPPPPVIVSAEVTVGDPWMPTTVPETPTPEDVAAHTSRLGVLLALLAAAVLGLLI